MNGVFSIMLCPKTRCPGVDFSVVWYMLLTANTVSTNIPDQGSSLSRKLFCKSNIHMGFTMTWWIIYNTEFDCVFAVVSQLALIMYSVSVRSFLNTLPRNSFHWSYVIIVGRGYPHNHIWSTRFAILVAHFLLYCTISNHLFAGSIIVKDFKIRGYSWTSIIILYGPIISTNNLSRGMASVSLVGKFPYLRLCFLFLWQVLQTFMWVRILSLKLGQY